MATVFIPTEVGVMKMDFADRLRMGDVKFSVIRSSNGTPYIRTTQHVTVRVHRFVVGAVKGQEVDHINRDTLDNRRKNLRICNRSQNCINRGVSKLSSYKYKGVMRSYRGAKNAWCFRIAKDGKRFKFCGYSSEEEAAKAYNEKALEMHGEFAYLNDV